MPAIDEKKRKILLVEDDTIVGIQEASILENNGYDVVRSSTGESAVRIFADDPGIELILMDLDLGKGIDGAETARQILLTRDVPINFLTAHHEKKYVDRIQSVPNYGYILKNSGEHVLLNAVERGYAQFKEKLERENRYAEVCSICESIPVMTFCLDEERVVRNMNRAAEEYLDTAFRVEKQRAEAPVGNVLHCAHHDEDPRGCGYGRGCRRCKLRELFLETLNSENKIHKATVPMRLQTNGIAVEAAFRASAALLPPGTGKTVLLTMEDITELSEYEKLFHTITEHIPDIVTITDSRFHFTYISRSNEKITGYTGGEMKNLSIKDLLTPDSYTRLTELLRTFSLEEETLFTLELEHVKKDGSTFWAEEIVTPLRDGSGVVYGFLTTTRDITKQRRLREAFAEKEEKFRLLAENARDMIVRILIPEGRFEYVSPAVFRISGYAPDELKDIRQYIRELVHPEWRKKARRIWEDIRGGKARGSIVYPLIHKSGETRWVSQSNVLVFGKDGSPEAVEGIVTDVTDLKKKEAELDAMLRENRNLLTEINHRVSNNLATVEALAHMELSTGEKSKEDSIRDIINRVKAIHLIHDKLYRTDNFSGLSIPEYIRDLAEAISASLYENTAQFRLNFELNEMSFSPKYNSPLGILTAELLTNTFKYAVFADTCEINLRIRRDGETVHFTYRDSGTGLAGKVKSIDDLTGGTGMLLVRELVAGLDGEITLHTDNGTEFRISFPFPG